MLKVPVVSSKSLGELYNRVKKSDPSTGDRIAHARINGKWLYDFSRENPQRIPLMPGDIVTFHPVEGSFGIGFASDK